MRSTRGAMPKDLIFCVHVACCSIRRMAVASAGPVRSWSRPLLLRRRSPTCKPRVVLVPPSPPARGFSPNSSTLPALGVGVAGTSGKSTTVGMLGWILHRAGKSPTIMNGADMKNFIDVGSPFASARIGEGEVFVSEVDESDGSIAFFEPRVAVVNNISLDHKSLDELRTLFRGFVAKAQTVVLNLDNAETAALLVGLKPGQAVTYSLGAAQAHLVASPPVRSPAGIAFQVKARDTGEAVEVALKVPGLHNVANALAALSAAKACGVALAAAAAHLGEFSGIRRRLEVVGDRK